MIPARGSSLGANIAEQLEKGESNKGGELSACFDVLQTMMRVIPIRDCGMLKNLVPHHFRFEVF
jgi:hypothetical protein